MHFLTNLFLGLVHISIFMDSIKNWIDLNQCQNWDQSIIWELWNHCTKIQDAELRFADGVLCAQSYTLFLCKAFVIAFSFFYINSFYCPEFKPSEARSGIDHISLHHYLVQTTTLLKQLEPSVGLKDMKVVLYFQHKNTSELAQSYIKCLSYGNNGSPPFGDNSSFCQSRTCQVLCIR